MLRETRWSTLVVVLTHLCFNPVRKVQGKRMRGTRVQIFWRPIPTAPWYGCAWGRWMWMVGKWAFLKHRARTHFVTYGLSVTRTRLCHTLSAARHVRFTSGFAFGAEIRNHLTPHITPQTSHQRWLRNLPSLFLLQFGWVGGLRHRWVRLKTLSCHNRFNMERCPRDRLAVRRAARASGPHSVAARALSLQCTSAFHKKGREDVVGSVLQVGGSGPVLVRAQHPLLGT